MSDVKVALITAGGSGMGADSARALAADGFKVGILSSSGKGEALAKELGGVGITGTNKSEVFCDGIVFNRISAGPVITMPRDEWDIIASRIEELERIDRSASPLRVERLVGCLRALLLSCADARLLALDLPAAGAGPSPEILAFQDALEASFLEHPNADTLARTCGIPTSRLMRLVKEELGMTVNQAVGERLAIEARQRLRTGDVSVKGVCYALGFSDPLYFSRFFKRHFGASPTTFFAGHAAAD